MCEVHSRVVTGRLRTSMEGDTMKTSRRIALGGVALVTSTALLIGGGAAAFAHDGGNKHRGGGERGGPLASLVTDGTLTQDQLDAIKESLHAGREERRESARADRDAARSAALDSLVAAGTITREQADAIAAAMENHRDARHEARRDGRGARHGMNR